MKKLLFLLVATISLISCEDTKTNTVALQAKVDNTLYISTEASADANPNGTVTILGLSRDESIKIHLSRLAEGNFNFQEGSRNYAIYTDMGGNMYTTNQDSEGVVTISELNETNKTLSGTFKFNAFLPGIDTVFVSKGVLYDVPYIGVNIDDPNNAGTFSAKVNGVLFTPVAVSSRSSDNAIITSASTDNAIMMISVPTDAEPGEYSLPRAGFTARYQGVNGLETTASGTVQILEHNVAAQTIKAAFSFVTDMSEITEGQFNVSY
ncbi:DUF6252 family protein [Aequorivita marisscotiae]|jgi:hypothetical protein|uniref:DUF6252 family protein n=1 Tax=Aequorivita marisscotiae TaxID=3040348 RepID=A0ABY8KUU3_9FLAO|nr:DUF6252 family protein [Aequorivita sp. Ant34-E75]WGF93196.1 DUF6252 family protein [Aequorivita sp. Ant34-E75]